MTLEEGREQISSAAEHIRDDIFREYGYIPRWRWLDERRLRLYDDSGGPLITFYLDTLQ